LFVSFVAGILDTTSGHSHTYRRRLYIYIRSTVSGHTSSGHRWLDAADKMGPKTRCGHVWVPDINATSSQLFRSS